MYQLFAKKKKLTNSNSCIVQVRDTKPTFSGSGYPISSHPIIQSINLSINLLFQLLPVTTITTAETTCHAGSHSPSLALEGARLPIITHTCHRYYTHQRSLDYIALLIAPCQHYCSFCFPLSRRCPYSIPVRVLLNVHSLYLLLISSVFPRVIL